MYIQIRKAAMLCLLVLALIGCTPSQPGGTLFKHTIYSFGTLIEIEIYDPDKALAERAFEALEKDFQYMNSTWHPWQASALARDNQLLATGEWFTDAPSVRPLILQARGLSLASDELFNPAIGNLIHLWGFQKGEREGGTPPDKAAIEAIVAAKPSMRDLEFNGVTMRSKNPQVRLDFGAFAKGYGVNRAIELLKSLGIKNAIINAGGDLRAIGRNGDKAWRIAIRHPRKAHDALAYLDVSGDESVFTSGDYERYYVYQGKRYHHILDPRTGYPATGSTSVTVIHGDAAVADAAATALFVAGPKDWYRIARAMGIHYVLLVDDQGRVHMNPEMEKRVHFVEKPAQIILSEPLS